MTASPTRLERWDRSSRVPLLVLGLLFIVGASVAVLGTGLPGGIWRFAFAAAALAWVAFLVDYVVRIVLAPHGGRLDYVVHHPLQLLAVLIPAFRAIRVVDLVRELPAFRRASPAALRAQIVVIALAYAIVFVYFIALGTLSVERSAPGSTITSFGDAMWWAAVTLTTVGYGDVVPVTVLGRCYAVLLMLGGIVIIGVASGTAVSYINERVRRQAGAAAGATDAASVRAGARPGTVGVRHGTIGVRPRPAGVHTLRRRAAGISRSRDRRSPARPIPG